LQSALWRTWRHKRARTEAAKEGAAAAGAAAERLTRSAAEKDARDMQVRSIAMQETANAHIEATLIVLAMQNSKLTPLGEAELQRLTLL
jgi:hypothetical protein